MTIVVLPARMDTSAVVPLRAELAKGSGNDISIDATSVEHLGALCVELLLTAASVWSSNGLKLDIVSPSAAFQADLQTFGLSLDCFSEGSVL